MVAKVTQKKQAPARTTAAALIAQVQGRAAVPHPPAEAMAELRKVLAHNDATTDNRLRVGFAAAVELLQSYGWKGGGRGALDTLCRTTVGRRSYGTP